MMIRAQFPELVETKRPPKKRKKKAKQSVGHTRLDSETKKR